MKFAKLCREISLGVAVCWTLGLASANAQKTTALAVQAANHVSHAHAVSNTPLTDPNVMQASCSGCSDGSCNSCTSGFGGNMGGGNLGGCGMATCGTMCGCVSFYGGVEYLLWWDKKTDLPGLVTSSVVGTSRDDAGVLGFSSILYGGEDLDDESLFGERITLGTLFANGNTGIFGRFFFLEDQNEGFSTNSDTTPIFGRPFFNVDSNEDDAVVLSFPNDTSGNVAVDWDSETYGAELLVRQLYRSNRNYRVDLVYGYRHFSLEESLNVNSSLEFIDPTQIFSGTQIDQFDSFEVENKFHGFDLGFMGHSTDGCWTLDFVAKVAFGNISHKYSINGQTTTTPTVGDPFIAEGGLLTQNSNIGSFEEDQFAVMPEFGATLGYAVTARVDAFVGYNFIYINHIARTSSIIDQNVNLLQQQGLGGEELPSPTLNDNDYWLQGLTFGLSTRF